MFTASRRTSCEGQCLPLTQRRQPNDESTEKYAQGVCARARPTEQKPTTGSVAAKNRRIRVCSNSRARVEFESGRDAEWHSVEIWRRYVELNLNSVYIVSREIVPRMVAGSAVCNTSSIAGMLATPFLAAYAAAKAAVISYTRTLALQVGPKGIRVNAVAPGLIYTKIWEELGAAIGGGAERARDTFDMTVRTLTPLGREQTPEDIGNTVAFLCSDRAANITGQVVAVDGGIVLGRPPLRA
jgi:NAD(P)-dependent dehydrogenase (short-subunit alcohol dehydrogenase family)